MTLLSFNNDKPFPGWANKPGSQFHPDDHPKVDADFYRNRENWPAKGLRSLALHPFEDDWNENGVPLKNEFHDLTTLPAFKGLDSKQLPDRVDMDKVFELQQQAIQDQAYAARQQPNQPANAIQQIGSLVQTAAPLVMQGVSALAGVVSESEKVDTRDSPAIQFEANSQVRSGFAPLVSEGTTGEGLTDWRGPDADGQQSAVVTKLNQVDLPPLGNRAERRGIPDDNGPLTEITPEQQAEIEANYKRLQEICGEYNMPFKLFDTPDQAGVCGGAYINDHSVKVDKEYSYNVNRDPETGKYYHDMPIQGTTHSTTIPNAEKNSVRWGHTHGDSHQLDQGEEFSEADRNATLRRGPGHLTTTLWKSLLYDPELNEDINMLK